MVRRRERVVEWVRERERISVEDLSTALGASRETIRRDLSALAEQGRVRKVHGGAALPDAHREAPFAIRLGQVDAGKRAAAQAAAALFGAGDSIFVDVGTTTLLFSAALTQRPGVTVVTNGPDIARVIADGGGKVFLIGGEFRADPGETVGALATAQIGGFYAEHAVLTVGGLSAAGAMDFSLDEAEVARAMVARARLVTVIADGAKLDREALFQVCPLADIDRLVTDVAPSPSLARSLSEAAVEVLIAEIAD